MQDILLGSTYGRQDLYKRAIVAAILIKISSLQPYVNKLFSQKAPRGGLFGPEGGLFETLQKGGAAPPAPPVFMYDSNLDSDHCRGRQSRQCQLQPAT